MKKIFLLSFILFFFLAQPALARSGCCSSHGGVMSNGCGCNDGTPLSKTCAPYYSCTRETYTAPVVPTNTPRPIVKTPVKAVQKTVKKTVKKPTPTPKKKIVKKVVKKVTPTPTKSY